jgi:integrase
MMRNAWWIDIQFNGARYRKKSPDNSKAGALAFEATIRKNLARGETIESAITRTQSEPTFGEFAWKWFDEYVVPNNKYSEQRAKRYILNSSLVPFFGTLPIRNITTHHVEQYKAHELNTGVTRKTINNRLTIFRKCVCTAYEWLSLTGAPPRVTWLKCPPSLADYLSADECELLLRNASGLNHEMILTALRTGMRQGELKALQWSSIDWQNRSLAVQHSRCDYTGELTSPKSNRVRHIPMDVDVYELLLKRKKETGYVFLNEKRQPFDAQCLKRRLARVQRKADLRKIGWHTLRHTFASHLVMKGVPLNAVQALLGHSTITTTMRYAHLAPSTLRAAVDMLNPKTALSANFGQPAGNAWLDEERKKLTPDPSPQNSSENLARIEV